METPIDARRPTSAPVSTAATLYVTSTTRAGTGKKTEADTLRRLEASRASGEHETSKSVAVVRKRSQEDTMRRMKGPGGIARAETHRGPARRRQASGLTPMDTFEEIKKPDVLGQEETPEKVRAAREVWLKYRDERDRSTSSTMPTRVATGSIHEPSAPTPAPVASGRGSNQDPNGRQFQMADYISQQNDFNWRLINTLTAAGKQVKVEQYARPQDIDQWLAVFGMATAHMQHDERILACLANLRSKEREELQNAIEVDIYRVFDAFADEVRETFRDLNLEDHGEKFRERRQKPNEPMQEYVTELRDLINKANAKGYAIKERDFAVALEKGAISDDIKQQMTVMKAQNSTIEEIMRVAISMASTWEQRRLRDHQQPRPDRNEQQQQQSRDQKPRDAASRHQANEQGRPAAAYDTREPQRRQASAHEPGDAQRRPSAQGEQRDKGCFKCGEMGHRAFECTKPRQITCYNCQEIGHRANECQKPKQQMRINEIKTESTYDDYEASGEGPDGRPDSGKQQ